VRTWTLKKGATSWKPRSFMTIRSFADCLGAEAQALRLEPAARSRCACARPVQRARGWNGSWAFSPAGGRTAQPDQQPPGDGDHADQARSSRGGGRACAGRWPFADFTVLKTKDAEVNIGGMSQLMGLGQRGERPGARGRPALPLP